MTDAAVVRNSPPRSRRLPWLFFGVLVLAGVFVAPYGSRFFLNGKETHGPGESKPERIVELVPGEPNQIRVSAETVTGMGMRMQAAKPAKSALPLKLVGQLMLDPHRLVHVHTRFAGEVVEIGQISLNPAEKDDTTDTAATRDQKTRPLRAGDAVKKDQLLAVLWCKEIGEKKSDLVDALSQLYLHEKILANLKKIEGTVVAQRTLEEMQRNYEADLIQVHRLQRTLRSWRIDEEELREVEEEARRLHALAVAGPDAVRADAEAARTARSNSIAKWAEVEVRAPIDSVILEKNFTVGDIVDTTLDLFRVADLSRLGVMVNVFEEDIDRLVSLPLEQRKWTVRLQASPGTPARCGRFETIGNVIDPNQHTAVVTGWLENPDGRFRVGQFVQATVETAPPTDLVEVPITALNDDGPHSTVFVALETNGTLWERRPVSVARRSSLTAWIHSAPEKTSELREVKGLQPDERVLTSGVLELMQSMVNLLTESKTTELTASEKGSGK